MRLLSFDKNGKYAIGILKQDTNTIVDLSSVDPSFPTDMNSFIDLGSEGIKRAGHIVENSDQDIEMKLKPNNI